MHGSAGCNAGLERVREESWKGYHVGVGCYAPWLRGAWNLDGHGWLVGTVWDWDGAGQSDAAGCA